MFSPPSDFHIYLRVTQLTHTGLARESDISGMVRQGTVYRVALLLGRTYPTEPELYEPCFYHLVILPWLCRVVWGPSRMGETPLYGLLEYAIWRSPVDSR